MTFIMSTSNTKILNLEQLFKDVRKLSYILIDAEMKIVHDLETRIRHVFSIETPFCLMVNNVLIPRSENISIIININSNIDVMPISSDVKICIKGKRKHNVKETDILIESSCDEVIELEPPRKKKRKHKKKNKDETLFLTDNEGRKVVEMCALQDKNSCKDNGTIQETTKKKASVMKDSISTNVSSLSNEPSLKSIDKSKLSIDFINMENEMVVDDLINIDHGDTESTIPPNISLAIELVDTNQKESPQIITENGDGNCLEYMNQVTSDHSFSNFVTKRKRKRTRRRTKNKNLAAVTLDVVPVVSVSLLNIQPHNVPSMHTRFNDEESSSSSEEVAQAIEIRNDSLNPRVIRTITKEASTGSIATVAYDDATNANDVNKFFNDMGRFIPSDHLALDDIPNLDQIVAFKILKLSESYEPEISEYIIGIVTSVINQDLLIKILAGRDQCEKPDGKFAMPFEDEVVEKKEMPNELMFSWSEMYEPKALS